MKQDELGMEIAQIALPAAMALAADPIASLVDTAFIGHIGLQLVSLFLFCHSVILSFVSISIMLYSTILFE